MMFAADRDVAAQAIADAYPQIYRLALRITRNRADAEDAAQDACLNAWRALDQFEGRASFRWWLGAIARNSSLAILAARRPLIPLDKWRAAPGFEPGIIARDEAAV